MTNDKLHELAPNCRKTTMPNIDLKEQVEAAVYYGDEMS